MFESKVIPNVGIIYRDSLLNFRNLLRWNWFRLDALPNVVEFYQKKHNFEIDSFIRRLIPSTKDTTPMKKTFPTNLGDILKVMIPWEVIEKSF